MTAGNSASKTLTVCQEGVKYILPLSLRHRLWQTTKKGILAKSIRNFLLLAGIKNPDRQKKLGKHPLMT
jgi:hypothetical protein